MACGPTVESRLTHGHGHRYLGRSRAVAAVVVTNVATNASQRTVTTGVGSYTLAGLQPGEYTLTAERKGFKTATVTSVVVFAGRESTTNVRLEEGRRQLM